MDSLASGAERRHLTWRDLPATPPVGPTWTADPTDAAAPYVAPAIALAPTRPNRANRRLMAAAGAVVAAIVALAAVFVVVSPPPSNGGSNLDKAALGAAVPSAPPANNGPSSTSAPTGTAGSEPLADTAARILPSVVQIETSQGLGTGFVADANGNILTANHVVDGSTQVTVKLQDGSTVPGTVVATDPSIDSAVVHIDKTDIPALTLGDSDQVRVGQQAIAVGSPFGLDETVTSGIVSALNRSLQTDTSNLTGLIQTDAPINPGNSGGPLTDRTGAVIGINDAIASTSGQSSGVGFAVPINDAKTLLAKVQNGSTGNQSQPQTGQPQTGNGQTGNGGSNGSGGSGTDPFGGLFGQGGSGGSNGQGGTGTDPFGGLFGQGGSGGSGTDPFGGLFGQGGSGQNGSGTDPFNSQFFQWFMQQIAPQLNNQGQSGVGS